MAGKHTRTKSLRERKETKQGKMATTLIAIALAVSLLVIAPIIAIANNADLLSQDESTTVSSQVDVNVPDAPKKDGAAAVVGESDKSVDEAVVDEPADIENPDSTKVENEVLSTVAGAVETPRVVKDFFKAVDDLAAAWNVDNPDMDQVTALGQKAMDAYEAVQEADLEDYEGVPAKLEELMTLSDSITGGVEEMAAWQIPRSNQTLKFYTFCTSQLLGNTDGVDISTDSNADLGKESGMTADAIVSQKEIRNLKNAKDQDFVFFYVKLQLHGNDESQLYQYTGGKYINFKGGASSGKGRANNGIDVYAFRYNQNANTWEYKTSADAAWTSFNPAQYDIIFFYYQDYRLVGTNDENGIKLTAQDFGNDYPITTGVSSKQGQGVAVFQLYGADGRAMDGVAPMYQYYYSPSSDKHHYSLSFANWEVVDVSLRATTHNKNKKLEPGVAAIIDIPDNYNQYTSSERVENKDDFDIPFNASWSKNHPGTGEVFNESIPDVNAYIVAIKVAPKTSSKELTVRYYESQTTKEIANKQGVVAKDLAANGEPDWGKYISIDGNRKVEIGNDYKVDDVTIKVPIDLIGTDGKAPTSTVSLKPEDLKKGYIPEYEYAVLDGSELKVYFCRNGEEHSVSAQIEYYKDGELAETEKAITASGWIGEDTTVTVAPNTTDKFVGYKYESTEGDLSYTVAADEKTVATPEDPYVVKVYYVADESITHSVSARVDYYKDGELAETGAVETKKGWIGEDTTVTVAPNTKDKFKGYRYVSTDPEGDLSYTVASDDPTDATVHVVNVYYVKEYTLTVNYVDDEGNDLNNIVADDENLDNRWTDSTKYLNEESYTVPNSRVPHELTADGQHYVIDPDSPNEVTGTIEGKDAMVTLVYTLDEIGDPKDPNKDGGDDIPDKYQQKVAFNVVNGDWNAGNHDKVVEVLNFYKGDKLSADADAVAEMVEAPTVGTKPLDGYSDVYDKYCWSLTVPPTGSVTRAQVDAEYTYTYPPVYTITVNYVDDLEGKELQNPWTDEDPYLNNSTYSVDDKHAPKEISLGDDHYILDPEVQVATSGTINGANVEITLIYTLDNIGDPDKPNKDGEDNIPDKYQKLVNFHVVNGNWNAGDNGTIVEVLNFYKDGKLSADADATAAMVAAPAVGDEPFEGYWKGYKAANWDATIPTGSVTRDEVKADYTYTYRHTRTITVIFEDEDGESVGDPIVTEVEEDEPYNVTEDTEKVPDGFEPNGDPTGDPVEGTADGDKVVKVPVKKVPTYTLVVKYVDDVNNEPLQDSWTDDNEYRTGASYAVAGEQIPAEINVGDDHYIWESTTSNASGQMPEGGVEVTVVYTLDNITEPDRDPDPLVPGDEIPDKYQVIVNYVSANENQGTVTGDISKVITLMNGTEYVQTATIVPGIAGVVTTALENNEFAGWDIDPNAALDAKGGETYTYTAEWNYLGEGEPPAPPAPVDPGAPADPAAVPGGPLAPIIAPVVEAINDLLNPLADEAIDDDGNPLFGLHAPDCWTHWLMILGALITIVYTMSVLYRRRSKIHSMDDFENEVLGKDDERAATSVQAQHAVSRHL